MCRERPTNRASIHQRNQWGETALYYTVYGMHGNDILIELTLITSTASLDMETSAGS